MPQIERVVAIKEGGETGVYLVQVDGEKEVFIRNGKSIAVVRHFINTTASRGVCELNDEIKKQFLWWCK